MSVARFLELMCLDGYYSAKLGLYFIVLLFTTMCDVWVAVCQPFVKRIYDYYDDDGKVKGKGRYSSSREPNLRATGSHSVTCHPTKVNAPHLTPAGTRFTYPGGMEG